MAGALLPAEGQAQPRQRVGVTGAVLNEAWTGWSGPLTQTPEQLPRVLLGECSVKR